MKKLIVILIGSSLLLGLSTCLDEIEIELPDRPEDGFVIQAKLIKGDLTSTAEVNVARAFQFNSNINQPVTDAEVRLVKEDGFDIIFPTNQLNGIYTQILDQQSFPIAVGDRFRVEVGISDSIMIYSDWEVIHESPKALRLDWQFSVTETTSLDGLVNQVPAISFGVTTPSEISNGERARLRWEFIDAYRIMDDLDQICYIENPYRNAEVFVLDGTTITPDTIRNYPLFTAPVGIRHIEGYYLTAYQQSLGAEAFRYWQEIGSLLEREGTIFDNPAGSISSNFSGQLDSTRNVYGYFTAYSQDTVRVFLSREDTGALPSYCPLPPFVAANPAPTVCDNCVLNALNSSLNKPYYWEE